MVQAALGGCLFLDEAYALSGGGKDGDRGDSFSDEALRTLLTEVENNRNSLCVVLAGYKVRARVRLRVRLRVRVRVRVKGQGQGQGQGQG